MIKKIEKTELKHLKELYQKSLINMHRMMGDLLTESLCCTTYCFDDGKACEGGKV
jgi:hypothetical protein